MGSAFHQVCPRYSGTLIPAAPTANRLWETFTYKFLVDKNAIYCRLSMSGNTKLSYVKGVTKW